MKTLWDKLIALIDLQDRISCGAWSAWDFINGKVNEIYGVDLGDILAFWEKHHPATKEGS